MDLKDAVEFVLLDDINTFRKKYSRVVDVVSDKHRDHLAVRPLCDLDPQGNLITALKSEYRNITP